MQTIEVEPGVKVIRKNSTQEELYFCDINTEQYEYSVWLRPDSCEAMVYRSGLGGWMWREVPNEGSEIERIKSILCKLGEQYANWIFIQNAKRRLITS